MKMKILFLILSLSICVAQDTTNRLSLNTWQQSSQSQPYGDLIRLTAEHGSSKGGIKFFRRGSPAQIFTKGAPFAISSGQTLILKVNGYSSVTVTFGAITTADQVSDAICKQVNFSNYPSGERSYLETCQAYTEAKQSGTSVPGDSLYVSIESTYYGAQSSIEIVGGTARAALGLPIGITSGAAATTDCGADGYLDARAWIVCHDHPNNLASNNRHKHISFEAADSQGGMQTRLSISHGKDVSEMLVSSAMLILDGYPLTISSSANSFKDLDFSRGNTGQKINRVAQIRVDSDSNGGDMLFRVYNDSGTPTTLLTLDRLSKTIECNTAIQTKIKPTPNNSQTTMVLTPVANTFVLAGTGTVKYISTANWQAGSPITIILQGAATLMHNAGSPTSINRPLKLSKSENFTSGPNGSSHTFIYDGSGYTNCWFETTRIEY